MARRKGKIAQLPFEVRERVNQALRDGVTYAAVAAMLATIDPRYADISEKNVENWAKPDETGGCGYNDWLRTQERIEDMQAKRDFALRIVEQNAGTTIHEAGLQVMATQLYEVIADFDVTSLKNLLRDKPQAYAQLANAMWQLGKGGLEFAKYRDAVAERKAALENLTKQRDANGGLSPETRARIEQELRLL